MKDTTFNLVMVLIAMAVAAFAAFAFVKIAGAKTGPSRAGDVYVFTDHETGCQYVGPGGRGAYTPRIAADGRSHMGCRATTPVARLKGGVL